MNYDKIGKFIQEKRKAKNLTQKELAERMGITDKAISKWERGQGCPDVSLLEILSKELGCSILELLKGREIENEVIPIMEADDYIREGINYSKIDLRSKLKIICNRVISISIIFIVLLLSYLNIVQIRYIEKEYTYSTNRDSHKDIMQYIDEVEKNIEIIKKGKGKFSDNDYNEIVKTIEDYYSDINKIMLLKYMKSREKLIYTINDLRLLNATGYYIGYEHKVLDFLDSYSDNSSILAYKDLVTRDFFNIGAASIDNANKPFLTYKYRINSSNGEEELLGMEIDNLRYIENGIKHNLSKLIYLTELVREVGDINE